MTLDDLETEGAWMSLDASGPFLGQLEEVDDVWYGRVLVVFTAKACDCPARCLVNAENILFGPAYQDWREVDGFRLWTEPRDGVELARGNVHAAAIHADETITFKPGNITLELKEAT